MDLVAAIASCTCDVCRRFDAMRSDFLAHAIVREQPKTIADEKPWRPSDREARPCP